MTELELSRLKQLTEMQLEIQKTEPLQKSLLKQELAKAGLKHPAL